MQTILGSGGAIGEELAKALLAYTSNIKLVSRNPKKVNPTDTLFAADLTKPAEVDAAIKGSEIVYVTVGFPYSLKSWQAIWPSFMANVIASCKKHNAKLVFFDNIYMYDANFLNGMDENTPINPSSKKGKIRAQVAAMILDEVAKGTLIALIARSADFYGPSIKQSSMLTEVVFKPLSLGKKANWIGDVTKKHSYTFTPDAGKATALLGNTPSAYNQVWHLPTAANPFTGKQWIENIAAALGTKPRYQAANKMLLHIMGLFVPIMKELIEMYYQNDRDYVFNSAKFEAHFDMKPTPYVEGIRQIVAADYAKKA